jgi:hypothetical protein
LRGSADQEGVRRTDRVSLTIDPRLFPLVAMFVIVEHFVLGWTVPAESWQQHMRSPAWAMLVAVMIVLLLLVRHISAGCWLIVAGASANLLSWVVNGSVPNYLTVAAADRWLAFNLPDVAIVVGMLMVLVSFAARAEQRLRRRAG